MKYSNIAVAVGIVALTARIACAETWTDDFENGDPTGWFIVDHALVKSTGGNPGGWLDSGLGQVSVNAFFAVLPLDGTPFSAVLSSGSLHSLSFDFAHLLPGECFPVDDRTDQHFALRLLDTHGDFVYAETVGELVPDMPSPWRNFRFTIPPDGPKTPAGWTLSAPDGYTWSQLLHNVNGITVFVTDPGLGTHSCRRIGIDNIVVVYGETVFADGFDAPATAAVTP